MKALVTCHASADADALGAMSVMRFLLGKANISSVLLWPGSPDRALQEIARECSGELNLCLQVSEEENFGLIVIVDTADRNRVEHANVWLERGGSVLFVVDHHASDASLPSGSVLRVSWGSCSTIAVALLCLGVAPPFSPLPSAEALLHALVARTGRLGEAVLPPAIAALALAGILADTDSLTGPNTRPADALAVAILHQCVPRLDLARRLAPHSANYSLSESQQSALKQVMSSLETRRTEDGAILGFSHAVLDVPCPGFSVVVGIAFAQMTKCDALFAIGVFEQIVVIVGRAVSGSVIDCAKILQALGGGGHAGAAAVTLHNETLWSARERLLGAAAAAHGGGAGISVASLLVSRPHVLRAPLNVRDAQGALLRLGVRQAPVLDESGVLLGLADVRVLARAAQFGLADGDAREFVLEPACCPPDLPLASAPLLLSRARVRMLCVMDPKSGSFVGLVHRSAISAAVAREDLLPRAGMSAQGKRLSNVLSLVGPSFAGVLERGGALARGRGASLAAAGGLVRDALLGRASQDVDLLVAGMPAAQLAALLHAEMGHPAKPVLVHEAFHTAVLTLKDGSKIDIATARSEIYPEPAALPVVEVSSLEMDLGRRDFSINALAVHLNPGPDFGRIEDHFNGIGDIEAKRIAVLHPLSFVEDPTRLFRAVRFACRYNFHFCPMTKRLAASAIRSGLPHRLSGPRLFHELQKMLEEEGSLPAACLAMSQEMGLLDALHPALQRKLVPLDVRHACDSVRWTSEAGLWGVVASESTNKKSKTEPTAPLSAASETNLAWRVLFVASLGRLSPIELTELAQRLLLSPTLLSLVERARSAALALLALPPGVAPSRPARLLRPPLPAVEGPSAVRALLVAWAHHDEQVQHHHRRQDRHADLPAFHEAHGGLAAAARAGERATLRYETHSRVAKPLVSGNELVAAGVRPGPAFARVLAALLDAVVDGELAADRAAQLAFCMEFLKRE